MSKTKVLIIDDSALMRQVLGQILKQDPSIEVVGAAPDPILGWKMIQTTSPDVVTLDVEMPRMDGITFLERLMKMRPTPVVMVSSLTERGCEVTLRALELGAVDFVTKPKLDIQAGTFDLAEEIVAKVKGAARVRPRVRVAPAPPPPGGVKRELASAVLLQTTHKIIALGASTGGPEALRIVLESFPADAPGTVITQHMPEKFTKSFADRLDGRCRVRVCEATDGQRVLPGHVYIAPGNTQMEVTRSGANFNVRVFDGDRVNRHKPSVDVLFQSCAAVLGRNCVGALLTGMGDDGARGLLAMRQAGAHTIAQDEASSIVFGMPREAIARGAAETVLPLPRIAEELLRLAAPSGARV